MRGDNLMICVLTKDNKPRRIQRKDAEKIVEDGGRFISKTRFLALKSGFKVPENLFKKGDRFVKDLIRERKNADRKQRKKEEGESGDQNETRKPRQRRGRKKDRSKKDRGNSNR